MKFDHIIFSNSDSDDDDTVSWSIGSDSSAENSASGQMELILGNMPNFEKNEDVETRNTMEENELINCKDFEIPVGIGERNAVDPQQVVSIQKSVDVEANKTLEVVESTNCAEFEIPANAGNDVNVAVGPLEIAPAQELSHKARNGSGVQTASVESCAQSNAMPWPTTCSGKKLELGLKCVSSKPNSKMGKVTRSLTTGRNKDNEAEKIATNIHRDLLREENTANNSGRSFWEDMDSDSGEIKEWMRLQDSRTLKTNKKRRKKARSCAEVYQKSKAVQISK
ncbi:hypothetical protein SLA2020_357180, partial [Shorea laevis]